MGNNISDRIIAVSWSELFGGVAVLVGAFWIITQFVFGEIKIDVRETRAKFDKLSEEDGTLRNLLSDKAEGLRKDISDIRIDVARNKEALNRIESAISELRGEFRNDLKEIKGKLAFSPTDDPKWTKAMVGFKQASISLSKYSDLEKFAVEKGVKFSQIEVFASPVTSSFLTEYFEAKSKIENK